jgi:exodeoxyribonuclease VII large subunit
MVESDMPQALNRVWGVAALVQAVGDTLQARYGHVLVRGEVASWTLAASGHAYFTLKDEQGRVSLRCVMFRRQMASLAVMPAEGHLIEALGQLSVYEARGELQLVVETIRQAGAGALYEQFLRMKAHMAAQGWFDASRKRVLPAFPRRIAVVTSASGAAVADVLTTLQRRSPYVEVWVLPCLVQGHEAPAQIEAALRGVRAEQGIDAVILCRGGGSLEDLWAFNDERVVRAVADCAVPVVCGVGHETDITLADLAADVRAPTPTAAAELVAQSASEAMETLSQIQRQMQLAIQRQLHQHAQRIDQCAWRIEGVRRWVPWQHQHLAQCQRRLTRAVSERLAQHASVQVHWASRLEAINPQRVLARGYAWVTDATGVAMGSVKSIQPRQTLRVQLLDGQLTVDVKQVIPNDPS